MNSPLISVIVPIYNVEKWLSRCVDSILAQTYKNLEILLVDDGSPDNCGEICDDYAAKDQRVKVIHKPNGGLSDARNAALDVAKGEYITFVDSDDYVTHDYISSLFSLIIAFDADISIEACHIFEEGQTPIIHHTKIFKYNMTPQQAISQMFYQKGFDVNAWAKLYHRSLFCGIRYPKGQIYEDLQTTFKLMLKSSKIAYANKPVYYYMFRKDSIEGAPFSEKKMDSALEVFRLMQSYESQLRPVQKALTSKLTTFSFHLLMKMPNGYLGGGILEQYIKKSRIGIIFDRQTPLKSKIACTASFLGMDFVKWLFRFVDRRKE